MKLASLLSLWLLVYSCSAQEFINLDFNNPDLTGSLTPIEPGSSRTPFSGNAVQLLRGWTLLGNGNQLQVINYQPSNGDVSGVVTVTRNDSSLFVQPNYSLYIRSTPPNIVDLRFQQSGLIPINAGSLTYFASGPMELKINGETVHVLDVNSDAMPSVDVSRFSGQIVDLEFHLRQDPGGTALMFDVVGFSQVPEPSTLALFGIGAIAFMFHRFRKYPSPPVSFGRVPNRAGSNRQLRMYKIGHGEC